MTMMAPIRNGNEDLVGLVLPKWFLQLAGGILTMFLVTFVPWATWQTYSLIVVKVQVDELPSIKSVVDAVRAEQITRSSSIERNAQLINDLNKRLDRLDNK